MRTLNLLLVIACLSLSSVVLLVWPFVAVASVMGLAGHVPANTPAIQITGAYLFHLGVLCYPIVYIASLALSITLLVTKAPCAALCASLPMLYIGLLAALMMLFMP